MQTMLGKILEAKTKGDKGMTSEVELIIPSQIEMLRSIPQQQTSLQYFVVIIVAVVLKNLNRGMSLSDESLFIFKETKA